LVKSGWREESPSGSRKKAGKDECGRLKTNDGGAVAQLGARLDGIEEVVGSNPIGSTRDSGSGPGTVQPGDMGDTTYLRPR
jgi:hypothetical protein